MEKNWIIRVCALSLAVILECATANYISTELKMMDERLKCEQKNNKRISYIMVSIIFIFTSPFDQCPFHAYVYMIWTERLLNLNHALVHSTFAKWIATIYIRFGFIYIKYTYIMLDKIVLSLKTKLYSWFSRLSRGRLYDFSSFKLKAPETVYN